MNDETSAAKTSHTASLSARIADRIEDDCASLVERRAYLQGLIDCKKADREERREFMKLCARIRKLEKKAFLLRQIRLL